MPEKILKPDNEVELMLSTIDSFVHMAGLEEEETEAAGREILDVETDFRQQEIDISEFKAKGFFDSQLNEIVLGQRQNLPVTIYAKECFNWKQMREIRLGLAERLNTEIYENPLYSAEQMWEIRMGLMDGLDVSQYAKLIYSTTDMRKIRKKLMRNAYQKNPEIYDRSVIDEDTGIEIEICNECMEAYLTVPKELQKNITVSSIMNLLKRHEIEYGILKEEIRKLTETGTRGTRVKAAQGKVSVPGKKGWYELFFENSVQDNPVILPDGSVDYSNINNVDMVVTGRVLARYHIAGEGTDAMTVTGIAVEGTKGEDLPLVRGTGITVDAEHGIYYAARDGYATYNETTGTLNVFNMYIINGDVTCNSNCLEYDGNVHVIGNVRNQAVIQAAGDVIIEGFVEEAYITAGQNVIVKGGINGGLGGRICADGSVRSSFFESAVVEAKGMVEGNYFLNSTIESDEKVIARGGKSRIMGGNITAAVAVEASIIGTYAGTKTCISVGDKEWLLGRIKELELQKEANEQTLLKLMEGKHKLRKLFGDRNVDGASLYQKTCNTISLKESEQMDLDKEIRRINRMIGHTGDAYVRAIRKLQQEVYVSINGRKKRIEATERGVRLTGEKDGRRGRR